MKKKLANKSNLFFSSHFYKLTKFDSSNSNGKRIDSKTWLIYLESFRHVIIQKKDRFQFNDYSLLLLQFNESNIIWAITYSIRDVMALNNSLSLLQIELARE